MRCPASPESSKRSRFQRPATVASVTVDRCWHPVDVASAGSGLAAVTRPIAADGDGQIPTAPPDSSSAIFVKLKLVTVDVSVAEPRSTHAPPLSRSTEDTTMTRHGRATPPPSHAPDLLLN